MIDVAQKLAGMPFAKEAALDVRAQLFSFTTVNDKGLLPAKAAAGTNLPA